MRGFLAMLGCAAMVASASAHAQVSVDGYVTRNGQYVQPHIRSAPNSSIYDNYSTRPNVNPYTGDRGSVNPYAAPSPNYGYTAPPTYTNPYGNPYGTTQPRRW